MHGRYVLQKKMYNDNTEVSYYRCMTVNDTVCISYIKKC